MDISIITLFSAGLLTFFTPCVLPLIPIYLATVAGVESLDKVSSRNRMFFRASAFSAGLVLVFVLMGAAVSTLGSTIKEYEVYLLLFGGVLIFLFGLKFLHIVEIPVLDRFLKFDESRFSSRFGIINSFLLGFFFGAGWSPCMGPVLASALAYAALSSTSTAAGMLYLAVYGFGFVLPFMMVAFFAERGIAALKSVNRFLPLFEKITGFALVVGALYLMLGAVNAPVSKEPLTAEQPQLQNTVAAEPRFIEFYSPKCPVCSAMEPVIEGMFKRCKDKKVSMEKIDVSRRENAHIVKKYRIVGVPTFILVDREGAEAARLVGMQSEATLYQSLAAVRGEQCEGVGLIADILANDSHETPQGTACTPGAEAEACGTD